VKDEESKTNASPGGRHGDEKVISHVPVLLETAIDFLAVRRGGTYIDATAGLGGHSFEIAKRLGAKGHLWGFDKDPAALARTGERLTNPPAGADWPQVTLVHASFAEMGKYVDAGGANGVLADLGVSSLQLEDAARGFSFQAEGPLDMRMDSQGGTDADQVVNHLSERELADVIYEFGEERRSRRIARAIVRSRPIRNTTQLAAVVSAAARPMKSEGPRFHLRLHPATRTFQAIRIYVNRELDDLRALFAPQAAPQVLKPGGRLVVISFHSLEDRIAKEAIREGVRQGQWHALTRKPVVASEEEAKYNPRSRSAKLRAAERVSH
jgi:16S rRNA (cytosine1402-N4)-methyltransferase